MQRLASLGTRMAAPRGLAIDGDDLGIAVAQGLDPACEASLEEVGIERVDHVVERVVRRDAALVGQETAQKVEALLTPQLRLDEIVHAAQRRAQHHKQDFRQRVGDTPTLAGIRQRRKMI